MTAQTPNSHGEAEKVTLTRAVIEQEIDWPCKIERLYSDVNQGCRLGVSRAITWFFQHVDEGIILEDDCVPHPDFFTYCSTLLEYFRYDTRVWCISGNNFQEQLWSGDGDYLFSQIPMCWGWATWRTRWDGYDSKLNKWPDVLNSDLLVSLMPDSVMRSYWIQIWDKLWAEGNPDSWAYRWAFTCVVNRGLTAIPKGNLVSNVGFGDDATHTNNSRPIRFATPLPNRILTHPIFIVSHIGNDIAIFNGHFRGRFRRFPLSIFRGLIATFRKFID